MTIDPQFIDLEHVEDVSDIDPPPTLAVNHEAGEHRLGPLGEAGRRLLLEVLDATDEDEPMGERVFGRLGLDWNEATWDGWELYWADADKEEVVKALKRWNASYHM